MVSAAGSQKESLVAVSKSKVQTVQAAKLRKVR